MPAPIHLHIDRVVIDEAVQRAGPDAVRAAVEAQLPGLLAARGGVAREFRPAAAAAAESVAAQLPRNGHPRQT